MLRLTGRLSLALSLGILAATATSAQPVDPPDLAIRNVTVVDVESGDLLPDQTVLVEGNRIARVRAADELKVTTGTEIVDGRGRFLIPGLWDMHTHLLWSTDVSERFWTEMPVEADSWALWERYYGPTLDLLVVHGVTGIREMWGDLEVARRVRRQAAAGERIAPRMVVAGQMLDGKPPGLPGAIVASSPERARDAVDSLAAAGSSFIKVYSHLTPEVYHAIVRRAREVGLPVAGHVPLLVPAAEASEAGQRSFEHLIGVYQGCSNAESALIVLSRRILNAESARDGETADSLEREWRALAQATQDDASCRALLRRLARNETWQVPTHANHRVAYRGARVMARDPRIRYVHPDWRASWTSLPEPGEDELARRRRFLRRLEITGMAAEEGVPILAGSDTPNPFVFPGSGLHDELELLVAAGLTPLEALQAATLGPARYLGAADSLGGVAEGKLADLVLLEANPLESIRYTRRIAAVVLDGRLLRRAELEALLKRAERSFSECIE